MTVKKRSRAQRGIASTKSASGPKNAGRASKDAGRAPKNAGASSKNTGGASKDTGEVDVAASVAGTRLPKFPTITLVAPTRTGRSVENLDVAVKNAEIRLKLAYLHRKTLDPALPKSPSFHEHAWSAYRFLQGPETGTASAPSLPGDSKPLVALFDSLSILRNVVEYTTRAGDPARDALGFGTPLRVSHALPEEAPAIIAGARKYRDRFPALTDAVLDAADKARAAASAYVQSTRGREVEATVQNADNADAHQLALDVLLDAIDHLRAAARATLSSTRPKLAEFLTAPLEPARSRARDEKEPPAPPTPPA